jgi:hypothetical protein
MRIWQELVDKKEVSDERPRLSEISNKRDAVDLWISGSKVKGVPDEMAYDALYNAAYILCEIVMRAEGWRTKSGGHHEAVFTAFNHFIAEKFEDLAYFFDDSGKKRHEIHYDQRPMIVSPVEVDEMRLHVEELKQIILSWLKENHPDLYPDK